MRRGAQCGGGSDVFQLGGLKWLHEEGSLLARPSREAEFWQVKGAGEYILGLGNCASKVTCKVYAWVESGTGDNAAKLVLPWLWGTPSVVGTGELLRVPSDMIDPRITTYFQSKEFKFSSELIINHFNMKSEGFEIISSVSWFLQGFWVWYTPCRRMRRIGQAPELAIFQKSACSRKSGVFFLPVLLPFAAKRGS